MAIFFRDVREMLSGLEAVRGHFVNDRRDAISPLKGGPFVGVDVSIEVALPLIKRAMREVVILRAVTGKQVRRGRSGGEASEGRGRVASIMLTSMGVR